MYIVCCEVFICRDWANKATRDSPKRAPCEGTHPPTTTTSHTATHTHSGVSSQDDSNTENAKRGAEEARAPPNPLDSFHHLPWSTPTVAARVPVASPSDFEPLFTCGASL